ncbi:MAG TPA: hypothetical protein DCP71_08215 [Verrucomicrobiales bacterium]|nr:hypothetical protein [Verrucomicrobiales bacterium]
MMKSGLGDYGILLRLAFFCLVLVSSANEPVGMTSGKDISKSWDALNRDFLVKRRGLNLARIGPGAYHHARISFPNASHELRVELVVRKYIADDSELAEIWEEKDGWELMPKGAKAPGLSKESWLKLHDQFDRYKIKTAKKTTKRLWTGGKVGMVVHSCCFTISPDDRYKMADILELYLSTPSELGGGDITIFEID